MLLRNSEQCNFAKGGALPDFSERRKAFLERMPCSTSSGAQAGSRADWAGRLAGRIAALMARWPDGQMARWPGGQMARWMDGRTDGMDGMVRRGDPGIARQPGAGRPASLKRGLRSPKLRRAYLGHEGRGCACGLPHHNRCFGVLPGLKCDVLM